MSFLSSTCRHKAGGPLPDFGLSPLSIAPAQMTHSYNLSPPAHPPGHSVLCGAPHMPTPADRAHMLRTDVDGCARPAASPSSRNQPSAARQISFADALHDGDLQASVRGPIALNMECIPPSALQRQRSRMRSSAPPEYLGGVSLLDPEDLGFGALGFEESAPSLSNDGRCPWTNTSQDAYAPPLNQPPSSAAAGAQAALPAVAALHPEPAESAPVIFSGSHVAVPRIHLPVSGEALEAETSSSATALPVKSSCRPSVQMAQADLTNSGVANAAAGVAGTFSLLVHFVHLFEMQHCIRMPTVKSVAMMSVPVNVCLCGRVHVVEPVRLSGESASLAMSASL
jgi:hypothetical protein